MPIFPGDTPEAIDENSLKWAVNMSARTEWLGEFVGLQNCNLLCTVAEAIEIVKMEHARKNAEPAMVHKWLRDNVTRGISDCPNMAAVKRDMDNWATN